jgi:hypothetical protein
MDTLPPPPGESGAHIGRLAGTTSNTEILGTPQERRYKLVHRDAANVATKHMSQVAHLKLVRKTGSHKNKKPHAVGCEYIIPLANGGQLTVLRTAVVRRALHNEFITTRRGKPPWSTNTFVHTVCHIEHHDVVNSGIFVDEFPHKRLREWTKQALITVEEATEAYMVEVTAEFHC